MDIFQTFIDDIPNPEHKQRVIEVLNHVSETFPQLQKRVAWSQPMFTDHGTFIIAFSLAKNIWRSHLSWRGFNTLRSVWIKRGLRMGR